VIRTGAQGYDFLGYPMLANVILKPNVAPKGQVSIDESVYRHGHVMNPIAIGRMTWGATDVLEMTVTGSVKVPDSGAGYGTRFNYDYDHGKILREDTYIINRHDDVWNVTGSYRQPLWDGQVRVNRAVQRNTHVRAAGRRRIFSHRHPFARYRNRIQDQQRIRRAV